MNRSIILIGLYLLMACQPESQKEQSNTTSAEKSEAVKSEQQKKTILFFGNSITAGYQLDLSEAFPALIQERLDSLGLNYRTVNAGLSGETTASGNSRVDWVLKNPVDIFVLELGANDGLRGIGVAEARKNLESIIEKVKTKYPECKILLAGMMVPPNMGQDYSDNFQKIYTDLAEKYGIPLIPFLLEGVAGNSELNLEDGIHPTPDGHEILAENVWKHLAPML
ncbi:MAG: arylesterase [Reichenbachiella sp.]|uniref:arylesterase n=1 Tax=Reichenbachiella sp. TaxID=2184521 RepID=UPI00296640A8|nr:arylesterase [Reichenbachiella sp.]MDW3212227.1 arylesterase [Reichenbachiella sp.]